MNQLSNLSNVIVTSGVSNAQAPNSSINSANVTKEIAAQASSAPVDTAVISSAASDSASTQLVNNLTSGTSGGAGIGSAVGSALGSVATTNAEATTATAAETNEVDSAQDFDKHVASFIDDYLTKKNSPVAGKGAGELMVAQGKANDVDPLILLAIAGHETVYGTKGIGADGMLGVGAVDNNPQNATKNAKYKGFENQITVGATTFRQLRAKGKSSSSDPIDKQIETVNKNGWASDQNWYKDVSKIYGQLVMGIINY